MSEKAPTQRERPDAAAPAVPAFVIVDHTDEATREAIAEAIAAWNWVQHQRASGQLPN